MKYPVGTILDADGIRGIVVENHKLPGDICVVWESSPQIISYDPAFLDEFAKIKNDDIQRR